MKVIHPYPWIHYKISTLFFKWFIWVAETLWIESVDKEGTIRAFKHLPGKVAWNTLHGTNKSNDFVESQVIIPAGPQYPIIARVKQSKLIWPHESTTTLSGTLEPLRWRWVGKSSKSMPRWSREITGLQWWKRLVVPCVACSPPTQDKVVRFVSHCVSPVVLLGNR